MKNYGPGVILKLTRMLSSEIDTESLSCDIMRSAMEISNAEKGFCFFTENGEPVLNAEGTLIHGQEGLSISVHAAGPLPPGKSVFDSTGPRMALSVLRHVFTTGEDVVLNDIILHPEFGDDSHVKETGPGSLLCVRRDSGMSQVLLYLESAAPREDADSGGSGFLGLLAAQGAVSLENARRYQEQEKTLRQLKHVRSIKDSLLRYNERLRFDTLQQKINAPFLTTAMNTLRELAEKDMEQADSATIFLGEVFRYITDESFNPLVPFHREWEFVKAYLDFEKLRLFPNFSTSMDCAGDFSHVMIPPLTLQSFIQVATDTWCGDGHGEDLTLHLSTSRSGNNITIETRCRGKGVTPAAAQPGLFDTTKKRLHHVSGNPGIELRRNGPHDVSIVLKFTITGAGSHA